MFFTYDCSRLKETCWPVTFSFALASLLDWKNQNILQKSDKKKVKEILEILPDKSSKVGESRARPVVHHWARSETKGHDGSKCSVYHDQSWHFERENNHHLLMIMLAIDMAKGSSTWFCSTTWRRSRSYFMILFYLVFLTMSVAANMHKCIFTLPWRSLNTKILLLTYSLSY